MKSYPFALALLFPGFGWVRAAIYAYLLAAAAFVLYCVALLAGLYALGDPPGLE